MILDRIYPTLKNFPKSEKYSLCAEIKKEFFTLIKYLLLADKVPSKRKSYQEQADGHLQVCKALLDLAYSRHYINEGFFEEISIELTEVGFILSAWIKKS